MAATESQVAELRRKVVEPTTDTYGDSVLAEYIEKYPLIDADGNLPDEADWTARYDLNAAAADVWDEKASALSANYDFQADGGSYQRSQAYDQAMKQARYYRSRRSARTSQMIPTPKNPVSLAEDA